MALIVLRCLSFSSFNFLSASSRALLRSSTSFSALLVSDFPLSLKFFKRVSLSASGAFAELAHEFTGGWRIRATAQTAQQERMDKYAYVGSGAVTPTNGFTNQIAYSGENFTRQNSFDVNLSGSVNLFGRSHDLLIGADYQTKDNKYSEWRHSAFARIDVFNPVTNVPEPFYGNNGGGRSEVEQYGVYGNARLRPFDNTIVTLGGRLSWYENSTRSGGTRATPTNPPQPWTYGPWSTYKVEHEFTPYLGVVHDLNENW